MVSFISIGYIAAAHGIKGQIKLRTESEHIQDYSTLFNHTGDIVFSSKYSGKWKDGAILKLDGIDNRTQAEKLVGTNLYIRDDMLPTDSADEFSFHILSQCQVYTEDGVLFGTVDTVNNFGASDIIDIKLATSGRIESFPFTKTVFPTVDIENKRLVITPPEIIIHKE